MLGINLMTIIKPFLPELMKNIAPLEAGLIEYLRQTELEDGESEAIIILRPVKVKDEHQLHAYRVTVDEDNNMKRQLLVDEQNTSIRLTGFFSEIIKTL